MPTYEFRCESGHTTDRFFRSMNAAPAVIECPACGESAVRQVSGGIGLVFKGSGFYITDYGKDGKKPRAAEKADATPGARDTPKADASGGTAAGGDSGSSDKTTRSSKPDGGSSSSSGSDK